MDRRPAIVAIVIVIMVIAALLLVDRPRAESEDGDRIYQIGTLEGLLQGDYGGKITVSDLLDHGEYGVGTFVGLDGEMIVIDGACYRVAVDGSVNLVDGDAMTPFASVTYLEDAVEVTVIDVLNITVLKGLLIDEMDGDGFALVVIHADFSKMTVRSVPGQVVPYPPLMDVIANQSVYELADVEGTLIGFYSPAYVGTIDQAGFHFHFISDDRTLGGHVLNVELVHATAMIDEKSSFDLDL